MRKLLAILVIASLCLAALAGTAGAKRSNRSKAVVAVKEAVAERYIQFEVGPPAYLNVDKAHISVSCKKLSRTKFKCLWRARNDLHERASGGAIVTVYRKGGIARLTNVKCERPYGHC